MYTVRRRGPPPITWAERVEIKPEIPTLSEVYELPSELAQDAPRGQGEIGLLDVPSTLYLRSKVGQAKQ